MEIKVHNLQNGQVRVNRILPASENDNFHAFSYTGIAKPVKCKVWLPVSSYLIEHPKGIVLIDQMCHAEMRQIKRDKKELSFFQNLINKPFVELEDIISEKLAKVGYKSNDIDYLIPSDLPSDYSRGLDYLKNAKKIMISDVQWNVESAAKPLSLLDEKWNDLNVQKYSFSKTGIGPQGLSYDLFGDRTVILVSTPEYSSGAVTAIIKNNWIC
ncbi:N-acyl homoserine lactonase family protein [Flavobacterium quisquiliarum]|uniref:Metallo-beta-lactamase superfamily protein n=1 Tax=Flavobacterium quisquiliarum TaxID=1834436 RepID=A0ABV8W5B9_9FLAO|nr:N-acyl homoserine lactonase family protein [Flavobacterium quisquiliarum]MBW1655656.1 N-acyl homoserine lactonase family protein [Flavobacterium quisquiliarum]NWL03280.1 MBL fold metallo-hydrolase [Flavobacterium collinsii]